MFIEGKTFCHHSEFISIIRKKFEIDDAAQMDYLRSDVQNCTFLIRDSKGNYGFRHRSFMEFFVAQVLTEEIRNGHSEQLSSILLPIEIRSFLIDLLVEQPPIEILKDWLKRDIEPVLRDNILSILSRLKIDLSDVTLDKDPKKESDAKLVAGFIQGDTYAFDLLYHKYKPRLTKYVRNKMVQADLVEDIVIDTFLTAWQHKENIQTSNIGPYLHVIAKHKCTEFYRQNRRYLQLDTFLMDGDEDEISIVYEMNALSQMPDQQQHAESIEKLEIMDKALSKLSKVDQKIILSFAQGVDSSDLAREFGISSTNLRVRRYRILKKLRQHMLELEREQER
jgi:RNA polymerase sigma-70 factor (ECF subfamily)